MTNEPREAGRREENRGTAEVENISGEKLELVILLE